MKDRSDQLFVVAALSLAVGVPSVLYTLYYFPDAVGFVAGALLVAMLLLASAGLVVVRYRDRIFQAILKRPTQSLQDLTEDLTGAITDYASGNTGAAKQKLEAFICGIVSQYMWVQTRRWIVGAAVGLLLAFAGLVGSVLLKQQNDLILEQNAVFRSQIQQQQQQIALQQEIANQTLRSESIRIIGVENSVKREAVLSLVKLERARIADRRVSPLEGHVVFKGVNLADLAFESDDLAKVKFAYSHLVSVNFDAASMRGAIFEYTQLSRATFVSANLEDAEFRNCAAEQNTYTRANLKNAKFEEVDLSDSIFESADVEGAQFYRVNFEGSDLSNLRNWKKIATVEGSNIANLRAAPEGFAEWALSNGAVAEPGSWTGLEFFRWRNRQSGGGTKN